MSPPPSIDFICEEFACCSINVSIDVEHFDNYVLESANLFFPLKFELHKVALEFESFAADSFLIGDDVFVTN